MKINCKDVFPCGWFSFHFNAVFFSCKKLFIFMRSHLFILSFMSPALGDISVKMLLCGISEIFVPVFSSRTLWCHNLYLSLLSTLNLFLCMIWVGDCVSFFCMYLSSFPNTLCWRGNFYSILCFCPFCWILIDHRDLGLFLGSLFWSIGLCFCSYASARLFWL